MQTKTQGTIGLALAVLLAAPFNMAWGGGRLIASPRG